MSVVCRLLRHSTFTMASVSPSVVLAGYQQVESLLLAGGRRRLRQQTQRIVNSSASSPGLIEIAAIALQLQSAQYHLVLSSPDAQSLFSSLSSLSPSDLTASSLASAVSASAAAFLSANQADDEQQLQGQLRLLFIAVALLNSFVLVNWTGLTLPVTDASPLLSGSSPLQSSLTALSREALRLDGEDVYPSIAHPQLLHIAHLLLLSPLLSSSSLFPQSRSAAHWALRCLSVHHSLLEHNSATVKRMLDSLLPQLLPSPVSPLPPAADPLSRQLLATAALESSRLLLQYWQYSRAEECLELGRQACGLQVELTGVMGRRTRWQQDMKSQLVLATRPAEEESKHSAEQQLQQDERKEAEPETDDDDESDLMPEACSLSSDVLLPSLSLEHALPSHPLTALQRCLLLGIVDCMRASAPTSHVTTTQQVLAFLATVLSPSAGHERSWAAEQAALLLQSTLEVADNHKQDRALLQLEKLSSSIKQQEAAGDEQAAQRQRRVRLQDVYSSGLMSAWRLQLTVGGVFERLGLTRAALDVYESIGWLDGVIEMSVALERRSAAEQLIRGLLASAPTPRLHCLLGDVTRDVTQYEQAWTLSGASYPRAQRSLARHYRELRQYAVSMQHSRLALEVNPVSPSDCFSLGWCAMELQDWEAGVDAFSRAVAFDAENGDCWNNLAACHLHLRHWQSALLALEQAVRINRDSWKGQGRAETRSSCWAAASGRC